MLSGSLLAAFSPFELHAVSAATAAAQTRMWETFIASLAPDDLWKRDVFGGAEGRRAATSRNLRGKRLQTGTKLGVGNFAQPFPNFLRNGAQFRAGRADRLSGLPPLPEDHPIDRGMA